MDDSTITDRFALPITTIIKNRYEITDVIGTGGFGITYKVKDCFTNKTYAMKEYAPARMCSRNDDGIELVPVGNQIAKESFIKGREHFLEEADILRQLDSVAGIVPVMDCFNQNGTSYFVMQYLEGITLREHLKRHNGRIGLGETLTIIGSVAYALDKVHEKKNIYHRDVSPDNIFITKDNDVRVIDFGNARYTMDDSTEAYSIILKPGFAPPEQYSSTGKQGSYTDVYSLASTMYYSLTGMMIPAAPERMNGEKYIPLKEIFPDLTASFSKAIEHALYLDYKKRTQNMSQFMLELGLDSTLYDDKVVVSPYAEMTKGSKVGRRWNILKDTCITLGRSKKSDISFPDNLYISKKHCELYFDSELERFYIQDFSKNGTYIKDKRIPQNELIEIKEGEQFALGDKNIVMKVGIMHV